MAPVDIPEEISEEELTDIGIEGGVEGGVIFGHHHLQAEVVSSIDSSTVPAPPIVCLVRISLNRNTKFPEFSLNFIHYILTKARG